jgi:hypothetical protein
MHEDAANRLEPTCKALVGGRGGAGARTVLPLLTRVLGQARRAWGGLPSLACELSGGRRRPL